MAKEDTSDEIEYTQVHRSLIRTQLIGGCERMPIILLAALVLGLAVLNNPLTWVIDVAIVTLGFPALRRWAKSDPRGGQILMLHLEHQSFYPANPSVGRKPVKFVDQQRRKGKTL